MAWGPQRRRRSLPPVGAHRRAHPCSLRRSVHAARGHPAPAPARGSHLRPRAAGPRAACSPSGPPPRPAGSRAPRRALAAHPPCDRPRLAAGARCLAKENRAGCPPGHPRPPISGGDPSREGAASAAPPDRAPRLAPPGGRGGRPRPRPAVTHSPRPVLAEPTFGATRRFSPLQPPTNRGRGRGGDRQKVLLLPGDPLSPPASLTLLPALESPRPGHRIPQVPALRLPRILHRGEKNPDSAPLRGPAWDRSSKVTRARIKKSNHFASCRSHPRRRSAAGRPPRSRCQAGSVPRSGPQEAPAQPDLAAALSFQELSLLTVPLAGLHEVLRARYSSKSYPPTWPAARLRHLPRSTRSIAASLSEWSSGEASAPRRLCKLPPPAGARADHRALGEYAKPPLKEIISTLPITMMSANGTENRVLPGKGSLTYEFSP